ncbi:MAG: hypothetical protein K1X89_18195 [Myxococcaceae bacterium]|nr:hypothetical protein [Myxococcaceae bacterium]
MSQPWLTVALLVVGPALVAVVALVRGRLGLALALAGLALPAFAEPAVVRALAAICAALWLMRAIDLVRDARLASAPAPRRLWHVFSPVDTRLLRPAPPRWDLELLGRVAVWSAVAAGGAWLALRGGAWRWAGGVALTYGFVEALWALLGAGYARAGLHTPRLHELPLASSSIQELWGLRWSQVVRQWMHMNVVRVWARKHSLRTGLLLAFAASGLGHAYLVTVAIGPSLAAPMFAFFVVQGFAVLLEERLHVRHWPRPLRHVWVLAVMLGASPLFVEATLECLGL